MAKNDLDDIKNLSPQERIEKLKKLESEKKKEIEEAQKLIRESEDEIKEKEEVLKKIPIPQVKAVDIDALFTVEERQMFKNVRFVDEKKKPEPEETSGRRGRGSEENLEEIAAKERTAFSQQEAMAHQQYVTQLSQRPIEELYARATQLYQQSSQGLTPDQEHERYILQRAVDEKQRAVNEGFYKSTGESLLEMMDAAKHLIKYARRGPEGPETKYR